MQLKIEMKAKGKKVWHNYKYWRNKCNHLKRKAKKHFFENAISENWDNSYLWKHIISLTGQTEGELIVDDITYNYPQDVAETLNSYFANIHERIKVRQPSQETLKTNLNDIKSYTHSLISDDVNFKIPLMKLTDLVASMKSLESNGDRWYYTKCYKTFSRRYRT